MDLAEKEIECVVSQIFEKFNQGAEKISTDLLMDIVSSYIGTDRSEFNLLKKYIHGNSVNGEISETDMKSVLFKWSNILKLEIENRSIENLSPIIKYEGQHLSNSISSISSLSYREQIDDLKNEISNKEYIISNLKKQLELSSQQIQQHEETQSSVFKEMKNLREKLQSEQLQNATLRELRNDYDEILDSHQTLKDKLRKTQTELDLLKKENDEQSKTILDLEADRQNLLLSLANSKSDKDAILKSLSLTENTVEDLRIECEHLKEKIYQQESIIYSLSAIKKNLEKDLQSMINSKRYVTCASWTSMDKSNENSLTNETLASQLLDFSIERVRDIKSPLQHDIVTSTPRNYMSLSEEIKNQKINIHNCTIDADSQNSISYAISPDNVEMIFNSNGCLSRIYGNEITQSNISLATNKDLSESCGIQETFTLYPNNEDLQENSLVESGQDTFNIEKSSIESHSREIAMYKKTVEILNKKICNMEKYQLILELYNQNLNNKMNSVKLKIHLFHNLVKERISWNKRNVTLKQPNHAMETIQINSSEDGKKINNGGSYRNVLEKIKKSCVSFLRNCIFLGTLICFALAIIHMNHIIHYCSIAKQGTIIHILPWNWISTHEFISSIFELKFSGPAPT